jgi:hypothetical protein
VVSDNVNAVVMGEWVRFKDEVRAIKSDDIRDLLLGKSDDGIQVIAMVRLLTGSPKGFVLSQWPTMGEAEKALNDFIRDLNRGKREARSSLKVRGPSDKVGGWSY